jgi:hypothetical protein
MLTNSSRISPPAFCDLRKSEVELPNHRSHLKRLFRLITECVPCFPVLEFTVESSGVAESGSVLGDESDHPSLASDSFSPTRFVSPATEVPRDRSETNGGGDSAPGSTESGRAHFEPAGGLNGHSRV